MNLGDCDYSKLNPIRVIIDETTAFNGYNEVYKVAIRQIKYVYWFLVRQVLYLWLRFRKGVRWRNTWSTNSSGSHNSAWVLCTATGYLQCTSTEFRNVLCDWWKPRNRCLLGKWMFSSKYWIPFYSNWKYRILWMKGDSGSGLFCIHNRILAIVGLITYGLGCGIKDMPGAYTSVIYHADFIRESIAMDYLG